MAIHPIGDTVAGKVTPTPLQHIRAKFLSPKLYSCGTFTARMGVTSQWRGQVGFSWNIHTPCIIIGKAQCLYRLTQPDCCMSRALLVWLPSWWQLEPMPLGVHSARAREGYSVRKNTELGEEESRLIFLPLHWRGVLGTGVGHISQATHWFQPLWKGKLVRL